jgi:lipopolysaccharide export system permease protein
MANRRLITVLDKMLLSELTKTVFSTLLVIVVIIVSRSFIKVLAKAIEGQISGQTIISILGLKIVIAGIELLPVSVFVGIIMVLGRMYRDQEMSALASAGVGIGGLYRTTFFFAIPVALVTMGLSMITAPWAEATIQTLMHQDMQAADIRIIVPGRFSEHKNGELVFYVEDIDSKNVMHKVFVQSRIKGKVGVINSETAVFQDLPEGRYIVFANGERVQGKPGELNFIIENFDEYAVRLDVEATSVNLDRDGIPTERLLSTQIPVDIAEVQRRLSIPLGIIVLAALAIPLSQVAPRAGVYGNIFTALVIYFAYSYLQKINQNLVADETIPILMGYVWIYLLMLVVVTFLLVRVYGRKWMIYQITGKVPT